MWKHQAIIVTEKKSFTRSISRVWWQSFCSSYFQCSRTSYFFFFNIDISRIWWQSFCSSWQESCTPHHSQFWYQVHKVWTKLIFTTTRALSCVDFELFRRFLSSTSLMQSSFGQINVDACNTSWGLELRSFQTAQFGQFWDIPCILYWRGIQCSFRQTKIDGSLKFLDCPLLLHFGIFKKSW